MPKKGYISEIMGSGRIVSHGQITDLSNGFSPAPVVFNDWSPLVISELAPDTEILNTNDLFWGSGQSIEESV